MRFGLLQSLLIAAATWAAPPALAPTPPVPAPASPPLASTPAPAIPTAAATPAAGALSSEEIRSHAQKKVFQLVTQVAEGSEKQSYGTAFVIDRTGLLLTNFHVVSGAALDSKRFRLLLNVGAESVPASVVAFDVLNDLALVSVQRSFEDAYAVSAQLPAAGEKVYSIGMPEDTVMLLIEGNFSDSKKLGPVTRLIVSAPLNHGMSGGPVVNSRDALIGVNDAILAHAQNLSFMIPVEPAVELARKHGGISRSIASVDPSKEVIEQMSSGLHPWISEWQASRATGQPIKLGEYKVAPPPPNSRCWEDVKGAKKNEIRVRSCQGSEGSTVTPDNRGGSLLLEYFLVDGSDSVISDSRKALIQATAAEFQGSTRSRGGYLGKYSCSKRFVKNRSGVEVMAEYCVTPVKEIRSLADALITFTTLDGHSKLVGTMVIRGFPKAELLEATASFIDGFSREGGQMISMRVRILAPDGAVLAERGFTRFPITIGRDPASDLLLGDVNCSRKHAVVDLKNGAFWFTDVGSSRGTFLTSGERITTMPLASGTTVRIGGLLLDFSWEAHEGVSKGASSSSRDEGGWDRIVRSPALLALSVVWLAACQVALAQEASGGAMAMFLALLAVCAFFSLILSAISYGVSRLFKKDPSFRCIYLSYWHFLTFCAAFSGLTDFYSVAYPQDQRLMTIIGLGGSLFAFGIFFQHFRWVFGAARKWPRVGLFTAAGLLALSGAATLTQNTPTWKKVYLSASMGNTLKRAPASSIVPTDQLLKELDESFTVITLPSTGHEAD